jgi:RNA polymerase-binding transcription factor DksA
VATKKAPAKKELAKEPVKKPAAAAASNSASKSAAAPKGAGVKPAAAKAASAKAVPSKAVPSKAVPSKSAPSKSAPSKSAPSKPVSAKQNTKVVATNGKNGGNNGSAKPAANAAAAAKNGGKNGATKAASAISAPAAAPKNGSGKKVDAKAGAVKAAHSGKPESKKPDSKKPESKKPEAAPAKPEPAAKSASAKAPKAKAEPGETPIVPKKGPIDLAQHKSVAEAAAAVANARGGTGEFIIINGRRVRAISTKGITLPKKSKSTAIEVAAGPTEQQIREIKTKLGKKELEEYRSLLHAKRRQLVGMLSGMEDEALRSSGGNLSNMPVHMADMGSDVYEQDFTLGMAETERAIITEIDAALQRIEDKTFGVCQMTGKPISKARLDAKPWAKYTIEAERIAESSGSR